MTQAPEAAPIWYLAVYGRCEISHFESPADRDEFMRAEMRWAGIDTGRFKSSDRLHDAYITHIHARCEGPVEWGEVKVEPPARRRKPRQKVHVNAKRTEADVRADAGRDVGGTADGVQCS